MLSVIIPASNEEAFIGRCLEAVIASEDVPSEGAEIIVAANACKDRTVAVARAHVESAQARHWRLEVIDLAEPGKANALNVADRAAKGRIRVYLDADVVVSAPLIAELCSALNRPEPRYASGRLTVAPPASWTTRAYARMWTRLPFMTHGVPGAGLFAVNAAGRERWGEFPDIISDDTYVRLHFRPDERVGVPATYSWPMVEGFRRLVRVRQRQDAGVVEVARLYPEMMRNEGKPPLTARDLLGLAAEMPLSFAVYAGVASAVRLVGRQRRGWARGR